MDYVNTLLAKLYRLRSTVKHLLSDDASAIFNLPAGIENRFVAQQALMNALKRGIIRLRLTTGGRVSDAQLARIIESRFSDDSSLTNIEVELTNRGGALWEKRASPMWEYFVDEGEARVVLSHVWIFFEAKDRAWLICVDKTLSRFGFFRSNEKRITVRAGWCPVYWKKFKRGYSLGINTGFNAESALGRRFLRGIAVADERLADTFSVLSGIWDAGWVASLR